LRKRNKGLLCFLFVILLSPSWAEARFINLGGSLDLSYGQTRTEQNSAGNAVTDTTSYFQQRYNLRNFGEIFNPRIGTLLLSGTFLSQDTKTANHGDQDFKFYDYSVAANLLPYISPLSLYYQRVNRSNTFDSTIINKSKDRLTTIGASWALSTPRLPRIAVSYNQTELEGVDDASRHPNSINRFLNLESNGRIGETTLIGRYQLNKADTGLSDGSVSKVKGSALNLTTETRLAPALVVSTFSRIANKGGNSSGTSFSQERGFGASLFYTPATTWDTHARIDYSETPGGSVDLKRANASWGASYRPTEQLDMVVNARYFRFDISNVTTSSPFIDYSLNYRPFFGFSSGFGASYGETDTKAAGASVKTNFQRYRGYMNYTRSLEVLRYTTSYSVAYGSSDTDGQGKSTDLMNTIALNVENTRIRIVHVVLGYTLTDINRSVGVPEANKITPIPASQEIDDQRSHRIQLNADTSYFRGILRGDDSLLLQSSISWTKIEGFGPANEIRATDIHANYYFIQGGVFSSGWTYQDYPRSVFLDSQLFYEELRYTTYLGGTRVTFGVRANQEHTDGLVGLDRNTIEANGSMGYRIGKFSWSLEGRWSEDLSKSNGTDVSYKSQSIFARMGRSF